MAEVRASASDKLEWLTAAIHFYNDARLAAPGRPHAAPLRGRMPQVWSHALPEHLHRVDARRRIEPPPWEERA